MLGKEADGEEEGEGLNEDSAPPDKLGLVEEEGVETGSVRF